MPEAFASVDEYLESCEPQRKAALLRLCKLVRETVPDSTESIRYGMPYHEYRGPLCAYAAQKRYVSFYLLNGEVVEQHRNLLEGLDVGKECIRFKPAQEIPEAVLRTLLRAAAAANEQSFNDYC